MTLLRVAESATAEAASSTASLRLELPPAAVEAIAARAAELVLQQLEGADRASSPYLNVDEAAEYLRCSKQRIYDLLSARRLTRYKDGSRVLVVREELDSLVAPSLPSRRRSLSGSGVAA